MSKQEIEAQVSLLYERGELRTPLCPSPIEVAITPIDERPAEWEAHFAGCPYCQRGLFLRSLPAGLSDDEFAAAARAAGYVVKPRTQGEEVVGFWDQVAVMLDGVLGVTISGEELEKAARRRFSWQSRRPTALAAVHMAAGGRGPVHALARALAGPARVYASGDPGRATGMLRDFITKNYSLDEAGADELAAWTLV